MKSEAMHDPERSEGLSFIEQLQKLSLNECSTPNRIYMLGRDLNTREMLFTRPPCKMWACPECASRNAKRYIAIIIHGVNELGGNWYMFTLTAHENWRGVTSLDNLRFGWKKLYSKIRYHFGKPYYAKAWDMHKDRTFHLHGLIDLDIPTRWLKDNARKSGIGYQTEIHQIDNAGMVAGYMSKYMLKACELAKYWPKHTRRIQLVHKWPRQDNPLAESGIIWTIHMDRGKLQRAIWSWEKQGFVLSTTTTNSEPKIN